MTIILIAYTFFIFGMDYADTRNGQDWWWF